MDREDERAEAGLVGEGLWKDGMVLKVKTNDKRGQDMCIKTTMHKCPEFNLEIGSMTKHI